MIEENFSNKINDGDINTFEIIFKSHYVKLTHYANKFLNDIDISEEIVSEALTFLWEKRTTIVSLAMLQKSFLLEVTG